MKYILSITVIFELIKMFTTWQIEEGIVKGIDEKAFVILTDVREVLGEGFKTYDLKA